MFSLKVVIDGAVLTSKGKMFKMTGEARSAMTVFVCLVLRRRVSADERSSQMWYKDENSGEVSWFARLQNFVELEVKVVIL